MTCTISALLKSENPADQLKGIEEATRTRSYFHILQIMHLSSNRTREVADAAYAAALAMARQCLQPENETLPETVIHAAVKIIDSLDPEFVNNLHEQLKSDDPEEVIDAVVELKYFINRERVTPLLDELLCHEDEEVRAAAVLHFGGVASRITADNLLEYLQSTNNRIKANIIEIIEKSRDTSFLEILERFRIDENNRVRANALKALFHMGETNLGDDFRFMLMDPNPLMRASAVWALGELGQKAGEILGLLEIVSTDTEEIVQKNILLLLRKVNDTPLLDPLRELFADSIAGAAD